MSYVESSSISRLWTTRLRVTMSGLQGGRKINNRDLRFRECAQILQDGWMSPFLTIPDDIQTHLVCRVCLEHQLQSPPLPCESTGEKAWLFCGSWVLREDVRFTARCVRAPRVRTSSLGPRVLCDDVRVHVLDRFEEIGVRVDVKGGIN